MFFFFKRGSVNAISSRLDFTVRSPSKGIHPFMSVHCRKLIYSAAGLLIFSFFVIALPCRAPGQTVEPIHSHEVHPDGTITFRYRDTGAKQVQVSVGGLKTPIPMTNIDGIWIATTPQLPPEIYWYYFIVDGQPQMDPLNGVVLPNYVYLNNVVVVPGAAPQLWEATDVPHGELHHHFYKSRYISEAPGSVTRTIDIRHRITAQSIVITTFTHRPVTTQRPATDIRFSIYSTATLRRQRTGLFRAEPISSSTTSLQRTKLSRRFWSCRFATDGLSITAPTQS